MNTNVLSDVREEESASATKVQKVHVSPGVTFSLHCSLLPFVSDTYSTLTASEKVREREKLLHRRASLHHPQEEEEEEERKERASSQQHPI